MNECNELLSFPPLGIPTSYWCYFKWNARGETQMGFPNVRRRRQRRNRYSRNDKNSSGESREAFFLIYSQGSWKFWVENYSEVTQVWQMFEQIPLQAIYDMLGACSSNKPADSAEDRAKNIFAKMDENNDGQLTQDEFLKGCLQDEELSKMLAP